MLKLDPVNRVGVDKSSNGNMINMAETTMPDLKRLAFFHQGAGTKRGGHQCLGGRTRGYNPDRKLTYISPYSRASRTGDPEQSMIQLVRVQVI
jgi:hypothetical protein